MVYGRVVDSEEVPDGQAATAEAVTGTSLEVILSGQAVTAEAVTEISLEVIVE